MLTSGDQGWFIAHRYFLKACRSVEPNWKNWDRWSWDWFFGLCSLASEGLQAIPRTCFGLLQLNFFSMYLTKNNLQMAICAWPKCLGWGSVLLWRSCSLACQQLLRAIGSDVCDRRAPFLSLIGLRGLNFACFWSWVLGHQTPHTSGFIQ